MSEALDIDTLRLALDAAMLEFEKTEGHPTFRDHMCAIISRAIRTYNAALPEAGDVAGLVAEWTKAAEGVTLGPWYLSREDSGYPDHHAVHEIGAPKRGVAAKMHKADASFFVFARNNFGALLDLLTRQSADIARLGKERDEALSELNIQQMENTVGREVATELKARAEAAEAALTALKAETARVLEPFADLPMPEQDGFTSYTRAELWNARALHSKVKS